MVIKCTLTSNLLDNLFKVTVRLTLQIQGQMPLVCIEEWDTDTYRCRDFSLIPLLILSKLI